MTKTLERYVADPDAIAVNMARWGKDARLMPRTFDSEGMTYRVDGPDGAIGKMLPGRGFLSAVPLASLGVTKAPPNVYCPDRYRHIEDQVRERMERAGLVPIVRETRMIPGPGGRMMPSIQGGAITTYDQIIASRGQGKANDIAFTKVSITTVANVWSTIWHAGGQPAAGTYLATTAPTDRAGTGLDSGHPAGIPISAFLSNPTGTDKKYLLTFGYTAGQQINMAVLVDLQNDGGSFRASVNTAETVATPTNATRQYGSGTGIGNLLTFIVATAGTPGAGTFIAQYVDQAAANTNAPTLTVAAVAMTADTIFPSASTVVTAGAGSFFVPLASGSTGVQAVKQTTFSVAGTGVLASNVFFPLSMVPGLAANAYIERDSTTQIDGITELINVSSVIGHLAVYVLTNTTSTGALTGFLRTCAG